MSLNITTHHYPSQHTTTHHYLFLCRLFHQSIFREKTVSPQSPSFLGHLQIKQSGSRDENVANLFRFFFLSLSSRFPFLFIARMKSWLVSNRGTNLICKQQQVISKISSGFFPKCCLLFVCNTVRISQNLFAGKFKLC